MPIAGGSIDNMTLRVFLVDDHEIVRRGIVELLKVAPDLEVVGEASSVREALVRIRCERPDVAVLDVRLPDGNGVELCRDLRSQLPGLHCLMLTSYADDKALFDAVMAGASGYVLKDVVGSELVSAIRKTGRGESVMDPKTTSALLTGLRHRQEREVDPLYMLTDQERSVLDLVGEGMTNRQIAQRMYLSEKTVKNYVSRLLDKLGVQRRTQAAVYVTGLRRAGIARSAGQRVT